MRTPEECADGEEELTTQSHNNQTKTTTAQNMNQCLHMRAGNLAKGMQFLLTELLRCETRAMYRLAQTPDQTAPRV